jgi:hypothetical protein
LRLNQLFSVLSLSIAFLALVAVFNNSLFAQTTLGNTPFSRQPFGENAPQGMSRNQAMGGVSIGNISSDFLNLSNPAELFYNRNTNFETSLFGLNRTVSGKTSSSKSGALILNHIVFGFPLGKKASMALGLMPVSFLDYSVTYLSPVNGSPTDTAKYNNSGTGGLSKAFFAYGRKINNEWSVGLEGAFQFGSIDYKRQFGVVGRRDEPISVINSEQRYSQLTIKPGVSYRKQLDTAGRTFVTLGLTYQLGNNASVKQKILSQQLTYFYNDPFFSDTLQDVTGQKVRMPSILSLGASYSKFLNYTIATQITYTDWNQYKGINGNGSGVSSTFIASAGLEWIPDAYSTKYYNIVAFRAGFNYQTQALVLNGKQVNQIMGSIGLGIPLTRRESKFSKPYVNFNLFGGKRGSLSNNNLEETFYAGSISLILNDFQWFQRYKLQ